MVAVTRRDIGQRRGNGSAVAGRAAVSGRGGGRDALPEHTRYADTGCSLHPSCLSCPLERCRYDDPVGIRRLLSDERDRAIVALQRRGRTVGAIARQFGISRRTVFRVLARARAGGGLGPARTGGRDGVPGGGA